MADDAIDRLLGNAAPTPPAGMDAQGWRAYFTSLQAQLLRADPAMTPEDAHARTFTTASAQFLERFPGGAAEAERIFRPGKGVTIP